MAGSYIEHASYGTLFVGREATEIFRLTVLVSALHLEIRGVKVRRGFNALKAAKLTTNLKTNDRFVQIQAIEKLLGELKAQIDVR